MKMSRRKGEASLAHASSIRMFERQRHAQSADSVLGCRVLVRTTPLPETILRRGLFSDQAGNLSKASMTGLNRLHVIPKSGEELFHLDDQVLGWNLLSFWRWSTSDLVSNATRGRLAEFIVTQALGIPTD